ncbi:MAG: amino acid transporter [Alphaproteobacteria bacterium]|nr:amino acid transporter [Alphaproteobacteria bacterium]
MAVSRFFRRKLLVAEGLEIETGLKRTLSSVDLILLGVGGIIGAGIFVLTGQAAALHSGPAILISFILAGIACGLAAYCYSELASMIPVAGSAYTYAYVAFGEVIAWVIGWALILEFSLGAATVAIGWSGYLSSFLEGLGFAIPPYLKTAFSVSVDGGINLPATLVVLALTWVLSRGIKVSSILNMVIVAVKVTVILVFVAAGAGYINPENYHPFMPFGFNGVVSGAAVIFFAYIGFDIVATLAQETKNPQRDVPIGILGSLGICTVLYLAVAAVLVGVISYTELNVPAPIATALDSIQLGILSPIIKIGAIAGLTTAMLGLLLGQNRIFYAMGRDGLLPQWAAKISPRTGTPYITTWVVGIFVALISGLSPIGKVSELVSIGTLFAFSLVCGGVLILRYTQPNAPRVFKVPFFPLLPILGVLANLYLMIGLPQVTWSYFLYWAILGLAIYLFYGQRHSLLNRAKELV